MKDGEKKYTAQIAHKDTMILRKRREAFDRMKKIVMQELSKLETPEEIFNAVASAYIKGNQVMGGSANTVSFLKSMVLSQWGLDITKNFSDWEPSSDDLKYIVNMNTMGIIEEREEKLSVRT